MSGIANILISHQRADAVSRMVEWWRELTGVGTILVAYGGSREEFEKLSGFDKVYVDDDRLRVADAQRERQSYESVFRAAEQWLEASGCAFVHLTEFDELPLVSDLLERKRVLLEEMEADVIGYNLRRVDGTHHAHYQWHMSTPSCLSDFRDFSVRKDSGIILSMYGFGSFWRTKCFREVGSVHLPQDVYLEIAIPSVAHHLGFRVKSIDGQGSFMSPFREFSTRREIAAARNAGAWSLHSVKIAWRKPELLEGL